VFLYKHFLREPGTVEDDIRRNLKLVLSTRRGTGYFLPTFGLSDVTYRTPEEMVVVLTREIEENIRLYEPRVSLVKVHEVYDDDGCRVHLVAELRMREKGAPLRLVVDLAHGTFDILGPEGEGEENAVKVPGK
jgi:type VI secretion system lysozyme-like protein